jgi:hypothetical protein
MSLGLKSTGNAANSNSRKTSSVALNLGRPTLSATTRLNFHDERPYPVHRLV